MSNVEPRRGRGRARAAVIAAVLALSAASPSRAQDDVAAFYAGRQMTFVIGYSVGAAYDSAGRVLARHMGKHLPGKPVIVIQNMPGAGSLVSANHLFNVAAKDGSVIGMFSRGNAFFPLLEGAAKFEAERFQWIGSPSKEVSLVLSWGTTAFKTVEDIRRTEMTVGATGAGADTVVFPHTLNATIGTRLKPITGYPGNAEALLALEKGEVQGSSGMSLGTVRTGRPDWLTGGKTNMILQLALAPHPTEVRGVPLALDFALSPLDRQVLEMVLQRQTMAYPIVAPPGVPADRVAALRKAFIATTQDPDYVADAVKAGFEVEPVTGEEIADIIKRVYAAPGPVIEKARAAVALGKGK